MVQKAETEGYWKCDICHLEYNQMLLAVSCEKAHNIIYVPLYKEDIAKMVQFFFTLNPEILPTRMVKTLMEYTKVKEIKDVDMSDM